MFDQSFPPSKRLSSKPAIILITARCLSTVSGVLYALLTMIILVERKQYGTQRAPLGWFLVILSWEMFSTGNTCSDYSVPGARNQTGRTTACNNWITATQWQGYRWLFNRTTNNLQKVGPRRTRHQLRQTVGGARSKPTTLLHEVRVKERSPK